jgi:hypothetical protein
MELSELAPLRFMASRIPPLDALVAFVPSGQERQTWLEDATALTGQSRWYPVEGGHRVVILYEGGPFDSAHLSVEKGAWDHEHCARCGSSIHPMTLCWVTETGPNILLCGECHGELERFRSA